MKFLISSLLVFCLASITSCSPPTTKEQKTIHFTDLVNIDDIQRVVISNNYGTVDLNEKQLNHFKKSISKAVYQNQLIKPGAISLTIFSSADTIGGYSGTGSSSLVIDGDFMFKIPDMNWDNYQ